MPEIKIHHLYIVGAGTGESGSLTATARAIISRCRYIAAGERLLRLAANLVAESVTQSTSAAPDAVSAETQPAAIQTHAIGADLEAVRGFIATGLKSADVCVLTSGDPGCFSILPYLKENFAGAIQVIPGISAVQTLAARLAVPWSSWKLVSLHGRSAAALTPPRETTIYFCDRVNTPQAVAASILKMMPDGAAVVGACLGEEEEKISSGNLSELAAGSFPGHSLLLVMAGESGQADARPAVSAPGIPDGEWLREKGVPLAKSEMRAVLLAKAQPARRQVVWDVGAGSGSYGIECSLLAPRARVIAVERLPAACHLIAANAERFGARVEVVCAEAPEGFETLALPDLVIIGGSGGALGPIFQAALRALQPGGRMVVTALLKETRKAAHQLFADSGLQARTATRVSIARGQAHDWVEHNPVIIFTGDKTS